MNIRIGNGYDIHQLGASRPLILGGKFHELLGYDADVLITRLWMRWVPWSGRCGAHYFSPQILSGGG